MKSNVDAWIADYTRNMTVEESNRLDGPMRDSYNQGLRESATLLNIAIEALENSSCHLTSLGFSNNHADQALTELRKK